MLLTAAEAAAQVGRQRSTIRYWVHRGWLTARSTVCGAQLFDLADVFAAERDARRRLQQARRDGGWPRRVAHGPAGQNGPNTCKVTMGRNATTRP